MHAFAPASVTVVFAPPDPDGEETRSRGASFALTDGVAVVVEPATRTLVTVDGEPAPFEPVERVLRAVAPDAAAHVDVRPDVPLGCGFGASGAATLATALAANEQFDRGEPREALLTAAHEAEVAAGTGLGDVFVQDRGGFLVGTDDGIVRREPTATVSYESFGGIATSDVLGDDAAMDRIREHGTAALATLGADVDVDVDVDSPDDLAGVFERAWAFATATGLTTPRVGEAVEDVVAAGGAATMAMIGETVVGVDPGGVLANEAGIGHEGARIL